MRYEADYAQHKPAWHSEDAEDKAEQDGGLKHLLLRMCRRAGGGRY